MDPRKNVTIGKMALLNVINFGLVSFWAFDGAAMPLFLTSTFGLSNIVISWIVGIGKLMIALSLFMGLYSDLTRLSWGKRRPLMLIGGLVAAPLIALIPHVPTVALLIPVLTIAYFGMQFAAVPYFSLIPEVVPNEKLGTANAFFSVFGGIGTMVAYVVLFSVIYTANKPLAFYVLAAVVLAGTLVSVFSVKEHLPAEPPQKVNKLGPMIGCIGEIFADRGKYKDLFVFLTMNLCFWLALGAFLVFFTKFMELYANVPGAQAGIILGVVIIVSIILAVPIGMLGDKTNRKNLTLAGTLIIFVGLLAGYFLVGPGSKVSGVDLGDSAAVTKLASEFGIDVGGASFAPFEKAQFNPPLDVNKDEMKDVKSDVMRWCLNGALDEKGCEEAVAKVIPAGTAYESTVKAMSELAAKVRKETRPVIFLSIGVIAFSAIGLTICFVIMATILPTLMPEDKLGLYMGFYSTVTGIGQFLSLIIAGIAIEMTLKSGIGALGYRWVFVQGSFFMLLAAIALKFVPYIPNADQPTISDLQKQKQQS